MSASLSFITNSTFIYRNRLNFPPQIFNKIGIAWIAIGIGVISYSKKLQSATSGASFLFAGGLIITLIGITALYTGNQRAKVESSVVTSKNAIQQNVQSGKYSVALKIARETHLEAFKWGLSHLITDFSISQLEKELLTKGSLRLFFDEMYQPRAELLELLKLVGMDPLNQSEDAISQINKWAQENLLRQGERWIEQPNQFEKLRPHIISLLSKLGFINATAPHFKKYQGALVYGALLPRVRQRLHYLIEQWKLGVRFSHLYFLSGERSLTNLYENKNTFVKDDESNLKIRKEWIVPQKFPKTECEMMKLIWEQSEIPKGMRQEVKVFFINATLKKDSKNGELLRPIREDTVKTWLKLDPPEGCYLGITNIPYNNREDVILRRLAPQKYCFDMVGCNLNRKEKVTVFLDEVARYIFQIKRISEFSY